MSDAFSRICGRDNPRKSKQNDDKDTSKKHLRKVGEKLRRDKLKNYLSVLAQEIPWIPECKHRVDRSQILKLTVNYLKFHHGVKGKRITCKKWKPNFLSSDTLRQCLSEAAGGFVMVVAHTGNIVFVSESIFNILGHSPVNVIGLPISNILHDDDSEIFSRQFETSDKNMSTCKGMPSEEKTTYINSFKSNHRSFSVRMQVLPQKSNNLQYETIHVLGKISTEDSKADGKKVNTNGKQNTWLMAVGRPVRNRVMHELSVMGLDKLEWCSQHSMDGTVLFTDQRISQCLGVFSGESAGLSCYHYIVPEDIQAVTVSHMKIMTDDVVPQTIFRLKIPNQGLKYIMSRSVIVRDSWTKEAKFISSINIIIDKNEGDQLLEEQKKKVDALIAVTNYFSVQKDGSKSTAQGEENSDDNCICPGLQNGTLQSPTSSDNDFESDGSTASLLPVLSTTDASPTENRSSTGSLKLGTPLLKSLLVGDKATTYNTSSSDTAKDSSRTSPTSTSSQSLSGDSPHPYNITPCVEVDSPGINSGSDHSQTPSQHKGESPPDVFSAHPVKNWTASLSEIEMDQARNKDLGDSPGNCSNLSNVTHMHTHSEINSFNQDSIFTSKSNSHQTASYVSQPGSVHSSISPDLSSPLSLTNSAHDKESLQHHHVSNSQLYPVQSSLIHQSSLPFSQSNLVQSGQLYTGSVPKINLGGQSSFHVQSTVSFRKSGLQKQVFEQCADQSLLSLHCSRSMPSGTIPRQQSPVSSNFPSSMPVPQQTFSESPRYSQLTYEQDNHAALYNNSHSENFVNHLPEQLLYQRHYAQDQSGLRTSSPWRFDPVQAKTGFSSTQLNTANIDNTPVTLQEDLNSSISQEQKANSVPVKTSSEVSQWKIDHVPFELAGQLHAKHKQLSQLLESQDYVLDQVQGNVSQFMDTQTNNAQTGTRILQEVYNLQTSIQEQRVQLSNIEEEFLTKILGTS